MGFVIHWHESAMVLHVFPIPIPPPTSLSTCSLWVFPVHQARALVSCIPPGLVICFTLDNIHVLMLFSWNIPPLPSPRVQKSVMYICVSFSVLHIGLSFFNRILVFIFSPAASYTLSIYPVLFLKNVLCRKYVVCYFFFFDWNLIQGTHFMWLCWTDWNLSQSISSLTLMTVINQEQLFGYSLFCQNCSNRLLSL